MAGINFLLYLFGVFMVMMFAIELPIMHQLVVIVNTI